MNKLGFFGFLGFLGWLGFIPGCRILFVFFLLSGLFILLLVPVKNNQK
jgi:hypothetical protein